MKVKHLAIVGGGVAGISAYISAIRSGAFNRITVFDACGVGKGSGLSAFSDRMLCNTPVELNSIDADNVMDFYHYCVRQGYACTPQDYVPRSLFVEYLVRTFEQHRRQFDAQCGRTEVVNLSVNAINHQTREIITSSGQRYPYDNCLLCLGPTRPSAYDVDQSEVENAKNAVVFGTKLSAIDLSIYLCSKGVHTTMVSPSGELPSVRTRLYERRDGPRFSERVALRQLREAKSLEYRKLNAYSKLTRDIHESGTNTWQDMIGDMLQRNMHKPTPLIRRTLMLAPRIIKRYLSAFTYGNAVLIQQFIDQGLLTILKGNKYDYLSPKERTLHLDGGDALLPQLTMNDHVVQITYEPSSKVNVDVETLSRYGIYASGALNRDVDLVVNYIRYITQNNKKNISLMMKERRAQYEDLCC
ncbi:FAD/NAD(P)-binding protein [Vibrio ouci]|uniref:FAD/NAD(P)-binding protein n=1 Tax=Vibrio ouci TaxID=2499078 RepID=A0A4Y8W930_9VIBR|nr:FAD/NAD(P)-binding protein [Vibrio ouci]TFH89419.1 FAD/NAD(P)-binding protein [Vibrio ouci]